MTRLKRANENGCPWDKWVCEAAAEGGHLECLKYLHEAGFPWDESACRNAARRGHLECLKYARENGCAWDEWVCLAAAEGGHLKCLKYLHENGCPWDESACRKAARRGHLECLQYFDAHPNFCRESLFKHPGRAVSRRHGLFQTYTTFSRTTHIFVSRRGALRILEELPSDIVIDMFLARALRLGKLKIYIACDNGIVDQATSEFQSLGG